MATARLIAQAPALEAALAGLLIAVSEYEAGRYHYLKANTGRSFDEHIAEAQRVLAAVKETEAA